MEGEQNMNAVAREGGGSAGPIIGGVVILVIIVLGGLYFWGQRVKDGTVPTDYVQSDTDSAAAIEADLNATDVQSIDAELYSA